VDQVLPSVVRRWVFGIHSMLMGGRRPPLQTLKCLDRINSDKCLPGGTDISEVKDATSHKYRQSQAEHHSQSSLLSV